jgi:Histone methylation protein DOT1
MDEPLQSALAAIEENAALLEEANFGARAEASDFLEFYIIGATDNAPDSHSLDNKLGRLQQRALALKNRLENVDERLFQRIRHQIVSGKYTSEMLKSEFAKYGVSPLQESQDDTQYDNLDVFFNKLIGIAIVPEEPKVRESDMVGYQPTPARFILQLLDRLDLTPQDVFYDLGSGLGHVSILVTLLSEARAKGIEVEPAYCEYSQRCAHRLNLGDVQFSNTDAREADYSDGTVFFMYTPFKGKIMQEVLARLKAEADKRAIRVCTYGPCTVEIAQQSWLKRVDPSIADDDGILIFKSQSLNRPIPQ